MNPPSAHLTSPVDISVIMPVRNEEATLQAQLDALAASQTHGLRWELVIADNGSTDSTRGIAERAARHFPAPLVIVDASDRDGAGATRNAAVEVSRGAKLAFCDGDDIVYPTWLQAAADALDSAPAVSGLCIELTEPLDPNARAINPAGTYRNAAGPSLGAGNCAVTRELYFAVGGYDETMGRFGHEDSEFSIRLGKAGHWAEPALNMRIWYRDFHDVRTQVRKTWQRSQAEIMLWHRHPEYYGQHLDGDMLRHQILGFAAWHLQLRREGRGWSLHDVARDGVTRLARYRAYRKLEREGVPAPRFIGPDPLTANSPGRTPSADDDA